jgi:hypothetical protein
MGCREIRRALAAFGVGLCAVTSVVQAHHSFASEFDAARLLTLRGPIVIIEWVNPHAMLWIDVRETDGRRTRWGFELPPPNALTRRGVRRNMLRPGETITVQAYAARDGRLFASAQTLTLANGHRFARGRAASANP